MRFENIDINSINPELMLDTFVDKPNSCAFGKFENLDWPQVLQAIADRCKSELSQPLILNMPQLAEKEVAARRLAEIAQLIELYDACDPVVSICISDFEDILLRAERGAVLSGTDLMQIASNLGTFHAVYHYFATRREEAPLLWLYAQDIEVQRDLERRLKASFDADGKLVDNASPELARLRERSRRLAESLRTRIESKLTQPDILEVIQDNYYTQREGRYVLPVKASNRSKVDGIVHATSASGQTVFIEPAELVELNNALRMSDFGIEAEENRILLMLSQMVGAHREAFLSNARRCLYLDCADAVARFSIDCGCHIPDISDNEIELYSARHPLLALRHFNDHEAIVVANDIMLHNPAQSFVISGANAGGKTVNLKTVGLFALMVKAGIPICAGASSCFPIFKYVFADIGDDQSIAENISTFSAHVHSLSNALPLAEPNTLYLLDEPFSGTDPEHASPLVIALIRHLYHAGAMAFVTTHFENVKAFALETEWIASASVSFDIEKMCPTYHLQIGHPGTSAAFEIARQHGLPEQILADAEAQYNSKAESSLEHAIAELEQQRVRLEEARIVVASSQEELDKARQEVEELREKMRAQVAKALGNDIEHVLENIKRIKTRISKLRRKTFSSEFRHDTETQESIDREMSVLENEIHKESSAVTEITAPPFQPMNEREIVIGKKVQIRQYHRNAVVNARSGNHVTLQLGILQVHAIIDDIGYPIEEDQPQPTAKQKRIKNAKLLEIKCENSVLVDETTQLPILAQVSDNTLDLRGLTSEDAIERTEFFIQSMQVQEQPMCYIIHGHGTGVLKNCIRQYLSRSPRILATRPGQYYEGGDGVTLAWIKNT
ncbi:MAG: Smr/MutS family protein [Proteobacteria bacterium]|nr:Smr/MutS family protein [Pseudomonadota bacterium]